jgi:hypothetical protein
MALTLPRRARERFMLADVGAVGRSSTVTTPPPKPHAVPKTGSPEPRAIWQRRYSRYLHIADFVVAAFGVALAELLRFGSTPANLTGHKSLDYPVVSILIIAAWVWFLAISRTRAPGVIGAGLEEFRRVWTATLSVFGTTAIISTLFKLDIARGYLAIALPLGMVGLSLNRRLARNGAHLHSTVPNEPMEPGLPSTSARSTSTTSPVRSVPRISTRNRRGHRCATTSVPTIDERLPDDVIALYGMDGNQAGVLVFDPSVLTLWLKAAARVPKALLETPRSLRGARAMSFAIQASYLASGRRLEFERGIG